MKKYPYDIFIGKKDKKNKKIRKIKNNNKIK